jgi:hypothetical protein
LSNTTLAPSPSPVACPLSQSARQNGPSYIAWHLITEPIGVRWVSWSRQCGSGARVRQRAGGGQPCQAGAYHDHIGRCDHLPPPV